MPRDLDPDGNSIPDPNASTGVVTVTVASTTAPAVGNLLVPDPAGSTQYKLAQKTANAVVDLLGHLNLGANANVAGVAAGAFATVGTNLWSGPMALPSKGTWPYFTGLKPGTVYATDAAGGVRVSSAVPLLDWFAEIGTAIDANTIEPKIGVPTLR